MCTTEHLQVHAGDMNPKTGEIGEGDARKQNWIPDPGDSVIKRVAGVESEPEVFALGQRGKGHGARIWDIPKVVSVFPRLG